MAPVPDDPRLCFAPLHDEPAVGGLVNRCMAPRGHDGEHVPEWPGQRGEADAVAISELRAARARLAHMETELAALRSGVSVPDVTRTTLVSTILDSFAAHIGGTWQTLAEHVADTLIEAGLVVQAPDVAAPCPQHPPIPGHGDELITVPGVDCPTCH